MKDNEYFLAGCASITVAILFPLAWIIELINSYSELSEYQYSFHFGFSSMLFLLVGLLSIYVYFNFMKLLHEYHNYTRADFPLWVMIVFTLIFYVGSFILDLYNLWAGSLLSITASSWIFGASIIVFGIIDLLIGVMLLAGNTDLPVQIKVFAIINLIMGVFELTIILSPIVLILLPVVSLFIAIIFFKKPEMIEIV